MSNIWFLDARRLCRLQLLQQYQTKMCRNPNQKQSHF